MKTLLTQQQLNERADKVFVLDRSEYLYDLEVIDDQVYIDMEEDDGTGDVLRFIYKPDMANRPQALDYLLGKRDDFND